MLNVKCGVVFISVLVVVFWFLTVLFLVFVVFVILFGFLGSCF